MFSVVTSVGRRKVRKNMFMIPEHIVRKKLKQILLIHDFFKSLNLDSAATIGIGQTVRVLVAEKKLFIGFTTTGRQRAS